MYYIYYNWTAKLKVGTIHRNQCGHYQNGKGKIPNAQNERNGRWQGPFPTLESAEQSIRKQDYTIAHDRCIKKC